MKLEIESSILISLAIALISVGVDLVKEGNYEVGIILVVLGIIILVLFFIFIQPKYIVKVLSVAH